MRLHADFDQKVSVRPEDYHWVSSPMPGVFRMMLERIGDEVARATSLVRYEPSSEFLWHEHGGGEEILVLEGVFEDEHGIYPAGTYLRNPPGTSHQPRTGPQGCLIFVKLHQFQKGDSRRFVIPVRQSLKSSSENGIGNLLLHRFGEEVVEMIHMPFEAEMKLSEGFLGDEIFVVEGLIELNGVEYSKGSWLRSPYPLSSKVKSKNSETLLYRKTGHFMNLEKSP